MNSLKGVCVKVLDFSVTWLPWQSSPALLRRRVAPCVPASAHLRLHSGGGPYLKQSVSHMTWRVQASHIEGSVWGAPVGGAIHQKPPAFITRCDWRIHSGECWQFGLVNVLQGELPILRPFHSTTEGRQRFHAVWVPVKWWNYVYLQLLYDSKRPGILAHAVRSVSIPVYYHKWQQDSCGQ